MSLASWGLLFTLSVIWGGSFLFAKVAVTEIPPVTLAFLRVAIACAALHLVLRVTGQRFPRDVKTLAAFTVMGLLNNAIPFSLLFWGQAQIAAGLASILNATTPIFTFVIAALWLGQETPAWHRVAGVAVGFSGVALMLSASLAGMSSAPILAQVACLGAAFSYGLAAAFAKTFKKTPPMVSAAGQLTGSTAILFIPALFFAGSWSPAATGALVWMNVLALGLGATALAYLMYFRLLATAGATNASLVTLLIPASAILLGFFFLGERLEPAQLGGLGILLLGLVLLDGRILARLRTPRVDRRTG